MSAHCLYRHFDKANRLLYIGISLRVFNRLAQHRLAAIWFDQIATVGLEHFPTWWQAAQAEKMAIQIERPLFNIVHAPPENLSPIEEAQRIWKCITRIEPRLRDLFQEASDIWDDGESPICANDIWYNNLKPRLCKLVGYDARETLLQSPIVYDVAYQTIWHAIPDCRHGEGASE